ncbi:type III PLP-dependent enzyme [Actinoplanes sp. NPDC026619]|uniref:type III PLP-dependent enzyme n=1 Tax=Actinoplanes sp. NPDC026619 TaxID=3155798 RepID=UPI0033DC5C34
MPELAAAIPGVAVFYAMKSNPAQEILRTVAGNGASFEVASLGELRTLQELGIDPTTVLYSNPVKPPEHVAGAHAAGLWRFSVDGPNELVKIAQRAPGAAVFVRLRVNDRASAVPLSRKFGARPDDAHQLMLTARRLGLRPYGVMFHVGSQCTDPRAWPAAIAAAGTLMRRLLDDGIELEMLDLGGGFPARYVEPVPSIRQIGLAIAEGLDTLPYRPALLAAEPGRFLVAEAGRLAARVIGREQRDGVNWLFLEVGAYHGLGEVLPTPGGWRYPMSSSVDGGSLSVPFTVTGPTCDPTDTFAHEVRLPAAIDVGDVVYLGSAGAYTLAYATGFNGFPPPTQVFVDRCDDVVR